MLLKIFFYDIIRFIQYGDLPTIYYIKKGMKVGKNFNRQSGTKFDPRNCWLIKIGDDVTMSNRVQILTHDFSTMHFTGYARFGRVVIGNRVFIGAKTTILMNVHIGDDVIIGANSLVNKDVPSGVVVAGVPAKVICTTEEYRQKQMKLLSECKYLFSKSDLMYGGKMTKEKQQELLRKMDENPHRIFYAKFRPYVRQIGSGEYKENEYKRQIN